MGGYFSGNSEPRYGVKDLADQCIDLDINWLNREDSYKPGSSFSLHWQDSQGNDESSISLKVKEKDLKISYFFNAETNDGKEICYIIPIIRTRCNFGGMRPWFICPNVLCRRKAAKLYLRGRYFLCRHCHNLAYASQRINKEARLENKAKRIRLSLGGIPDLAVEFPSKPKRLHWKTYQRLYDAAYEADYQALKIRGLVGIIE
jgi:hypothetical protein